MATTQTKAQQDFINQARKSKAQTVKDNLAASTVAHEIEDDDIKMMEQIKAMIAGMGLPSWKRTICAMLTGIAVGAGVGYITSTVVGILMSGAIATTSYFIGIALAVLAWIVGGYLAVKFAARAFGYVATSSIDEDISVVKNKVFGWFKSKEIIVA